MRSTPAQVANLAMRLTLVLHCIVLLLKSHLMCPEKKGCHWSKEHIPLNRLCPPSGPGAPHSGWGVQRARVLWWTHTRVRCCLQRIGASVQPTRPDCGCGLRMHIHCDVATPSGVHRNTSTTVQVMRARISAHANGTTASVPNGRNCCAHALQHGIVCPEW